MSDSAPQGTTATTAVRLFGGLRLLRAGEPVAPPVGTCAALVRIVASSGALHVDELTEALWPDSAPGAGRARLRNVLSRVRASCGDVVVRVGESVAVSDEVEVDLAVFESLARRALATREDDAQREACAKRALSWCTGELLPEDLYREWAAAPRERVRHYRLALLDLLADHAAAAGDVPGALRRWQEAASLEPYDEGRHVKMAALLVDDGRWGAAHAVLERATAALAELGLSESPGLADVRRRLAELRAG